MLELGPLDEDVGPQNLDGLNGHGPLVDDDEIDAFQGGDGLGAEVLGEDRTVGALVDEAVGGDGNDENVAELAGLLKMADVADVQRVENAVTKDDLVTAGARRWRALASSWMSLIFCCGGAAARDMRSDSMGPGPSLADGYRREINLPRTGAGFATIQPCGPGRH